MIHLLFLSKNMPYHCLSLYGKYSESKPGVLIKSIAIDWPIAETVQVDRTTYICPMTFVFHKGQPI